MEFHPLEAGAVGAGIGFGLGGVPGAIVGGLGGALSELAGLTISKVARGLGASDEVADWIGFGASLLYPASTLGKITEVSKPLTEVFERLPEAVKIGAKAFTTGLATGYIVEPYIEEEDGGSIPLGITALAGGSYLALRKFAPLGVFLLRASRRNLAKLTGGKFVPDILLPEEDTLRYGSIELPKVRKGKDFLKSLVDPFKRLDIEVAGNDSFQDILWDTKAVTSFVGYKVQELADKLAEANINVGSEISQKIGKALYKPFDKPIVEEADVIKRFQEYGIAPEIAEKLASPLKDFYLANTMIASVYNSMGGVPKSYLDFFGEGRIFQHTFGIKKKETEPVLELIKVAKGERLPEASGIETVSSTFKRGKAIKKKEVVEKIEQQFEDIYGRKMEEGDRFTLITDSGRELVFGKVKNPFTGKIELLLDLPPSKRHIYDLSAAALKTISDDLNLFRDLMVYDQFRKIGESMGLVSDKPITGYAKLPERAKGSIIKPYGTLSGKYVSPDMARLLRYYVNMRRYSPKARLTKSLSTMNRVFKNTFLTLNAKSYINALVGNFVLSFVNGLDPLEVLWHFSQSVGKKDGLYEEALRAGVFRKEWQYDQQAVIQSNKLKRLLLKDYGDEDKFGKLSKMIGAFDELMANWLSKSYGRIDDVFRYGTFRLLVEKKGMSVLEAARKSSLIYGYYGDLPLVIKTLRDTVMPFISFQWRIFPSLFKAFMQYPERYALTLLFIEGLQRQAFKEAYGDNWREGREFEKLVSPQYMQPHIAGLLGDFVRIPNIGELPSGYMYIGFLPWNMPLSVPQAQTDIGYYGFLPTVLIQNPVIRFISSLFTTVDPATGRKVFELAGPGRITASVIQSFLRTVAPSPAINHYLGELLAKEGWIDPVISWFNYYGTYPDGTPVGTAHMIWNTVAPSVLKFDPEFQLEMSLKRLSAIENKYKSQVKRALYRGAPEQVLVDRMEDLVRVYNKVWDDKIRIIDSYINSRL